ncbi:MAG: toprim domain-containing protein [Anaerolineae bacterium]|nr:toprim domain-containing protein [Anaerolineae bacterium]
MMMLDTHELKARIDCRDLIEHDLGKSKSRSSSYSTYRCPLHHETKGYSLVVYADHWHCFGKCQRGGDAITWMQVYHQLSFHEACERLTSGDLPQMKQLQISRQPESAPDSGPPDDDWQRAAREVARIAMDILWGKEGKRAWAYLETERGLTEKTIVDAGLGYIPGGHREWKKIAGLNVPCGIVIPWFGEGVIWGIKVRRAAGEPRYQQVRGGRISHSLYLGDDIRPGLPILLTEGEFDALIARQVGEGLISAAAIGSAANRRITPRWYPKFLTAPSILIRMDADQAGQGAASQIASLSQAARCIQVPQGKDVNEFYLMGGYGVVREWIKTISVT